MSMLSTVRLQYIATGRTYAWREQFTSWAWHWDTDRRAWMNDNNCEPTDPQILFALDEERQGVNVSMQFIDQSTDRVMATMAMPRLAF